MRYGALVCKSSLVVSVCLRSVQVTGIRPSIMESFTTNYPTVCISQDDLEVCAEVEVRDRTLSLSLSLTLTLIHITKLHPEPHH